MTWEYPGPDRSWQLEFTDFLDDIRMGRPPAAGLVDARAALLIVEEIYRQSTQAFASGPTALVQSE